MHFEVGQFIRVPFGASGATQKAAICSIDRVRDRIGLRRYRERSKKWNKHIEWWGKPELERALESAQRRAVPHA